MVKVPQSIKLVAQQPVTAAPKATPKEKPKIGERVSPAIQGGAVSIARNRVRTRQQQKQKRQAQVRYITKDPTPQSKDRIAKLRGLGRGRLLVIIGNGPSIGQIKLEKLKESGKLDAIAINKPDMRIWPTRFWAFFDRSQIRRNRDLWDPYTGTIFNSTGIKEQKQTSMQFKHLRGKGFSRDLTKGIYIGRSSVYAALQIGLWMEYEKIYVLGCDMNPAGLDGKLHFYGTNPDVDPKIRAQRFEREAHHYKEAAGSLDNAERQRFVFCSRGINPWPFMQLFPSIEHTAAIDEILNHAKSL